MQDKPLLLQTALKGTGHLTYLITVYGSHYCDHSQYAYT